MRRWLRRLAIGAVVLIVVLIVAAKLLLRSGFAADRVAAQIQKATGGAPVHVGSLDVGVAGSSLRDLQILEDGAVPSDRPWAVVTSVDADVSLMNVIRGEFSGGPITLRGPKLTFRLDKDNHLLTKLPDFGSGGSGSWSEFRIKNAQIMFVREGSREAVFSGINGTVRKDGDHISITGTANDSEWGDWTINGERAEANGPFSLTLHCSALHATPEKLRRVPFVPSVTWRHVTFEGDSPVELALKFGGTDGGPSIRYQLALAPTGLTVNVPTIELTTRGTSGKVFVSDGVVTLIDLDGKAAGGSLHITRSEMDFRGEPSRLTMKVSADRLNLHDLPKKWQLPSLEGRMSGRADLTMTIRNGEVESSGGGGGTIDGFLSQVVQVKMVADKGGYRFEIESTKRTMAPSKAGASGEFPAGDRISEFILQVISSELIALQPTNPPSANSQTGQTVSINLGLQNVNLSELAEKANLKMPFRLDGRISFNVHATIPLHDARDLRAYRATGSVELPWLKVEDLWLQQVRAKVTLEGGLLRLDEFAAHEPNKPPTAPPTQLLPGGTVTGTATLGVSPPGDLSAKLIVQDLPLGPLLRLLPSANASSGGPVDGKLQFRAPTGALKDIARWEGHGEFSGRDLRVQNVPADSYKATVDLQGGSVVYTVKGNALGGKFNLDGRYPAPSPSLPGGLGHVHLRDIDLSLLADMLRAPVLRPLAGRFSFDTPALPPGVLADQAGARFFKVSWAGKRIAEDLHFGVRVVGGSIEIGRPNPDSAGWTTEEWQVTYNYRQPEKSIVRIRASGLDSSTLLAPLTSVPPLHGPINVRFFAHCEKYWSGEGGVGQTSGKFFGLNVRGLDLPFYWAWSPGQNFEVGVHDATANLAHGRLTGRADLRWGYSGRLTGQVVFNGVDAGEVINYYSSSQAVRGLASGRIDLGGEDMRSINDVTARVQAKLSQAVAAQAPVFRQVLPILLPGVGANVQFQSGEVRATLGAGVVHVERLTLVGDLARLFAAGTIALAQDRLDLNVVANTGRLGIDPATLRLLGVTLPAIGPLPIGAINEAASYLSHQTISLKVTGTIKAPAVQFSAVPLLTQAAVRFFVNQAGMPVPAAALQTTEP
jgi:hypothetical protein